MSRGARAITGLVVLFAASFFAGVATSDEPAPARPGSGARALELPPSPRIDPLAAPPPLPALRRFAGRPAAQAAPPPPPQAPVSPGPSQRTPPSTPPAPVKPPEPIPR